jgi:hypothetical protein
VFLGGRSAKLFNMGGLTQESALNAGFVLVIVLTPLSILATYLRFVASRLNFGKVGIEDWLALAGLIFFLGWIACVSSSTLIAALISLSCHRDNKLDSHLSLSQRPIRTSPEGMFSNSPNICHSLSNCIVSPHTQQDASPLGVNWAQN